MDDAMAENAVRAPSPLKGERAGVRGEIDGAPTLGKKLRDQKRRACLPTDRTWDIPALNRGVRGKNAITARFFQ
jgi:hypothetical protein